MLAASSGRHYICEPCYIKGTKAHVHLLQHIIRPHDDDDEMLLFIDPHDVDARSKRIYHYY